MVSELSENDFWGSLRLFTPNDIKRMMDEQYISELAIASLEGITNKKDRLEIFYEEVEVSFPQKETVEQTFNMLFSVLSPIAEILSKTRWRNKTDFYTLFLSVCHNQDRLMSHQTNIKFVGDKLSEFSAQIYECMKMNDDETSFPKYIKDYAEGVRASTDYTARNLRQESLDFYFDEVIFKNMSRDKEQ